MRFIFFKEQQKKHYFVVSKFLAAFSVSKISFYLFSLKKLANSKYCSEYRIRISVQAFLLCHWLISVCASLRKILQTISVHIQKVLI
jgi:hypothetical protein